MEFKYCPNCKNTIDVNKRLLQCNQCGFTFYLSPSPSVAVILVNNKDQILFGKKSGGPKKGWWDVIGGFVEFHESAEDAVKRETKEELGISITGFKYFGSYVGDYPYEGFTYFPLCLTYTSKISDEQIDQIKPGDDVSEAKFFDKKDIPWEKITYIDVKQALKDYVSLH